jgi:hypothetical protein
VQSGRDIQHRATPLSQTQVPIDWHKRSASAKKLALVLLVIAEADNPAMDERPAVLITQIDDTPSTRELRDSCGWAARPEFD